VPTLTDRITAAHDRFTGWTYGQPPGVPELLPGIPRGVPVGTGQTDCTTYAAWVLLASHAGLRGIDGMWEALSVWDRARPWSGIEVLQGMGYVAGDPVAPGWYWVQSWSGLAGGRVVFGSSGHGRLLHVEASHATVFEARSTRHSDGQGPGVVRRRVSLGAWRTWGQTVRAARLG
jgi:hypothetical protein